MKVSIITCCFNREKTIRDSIESLLSQNYSDIEYIVIDGASKDHTMDIVNEYKDKIDIIVSEPDKGMYEGINKGIRRATGDIVGLLHSDDVFYANDTITRVVNEFERTQAQFVYGNGIFVKPNDMNNVVRDWESGPYQKSYLKRGWLPLHTTVFVDRSLFDIVGLYNENYKISADSEWLLRCLHKESIRVSYLNDYIIRMRMGGASTSMKLTWKKWKEDMKIYHSFGLNPYISLSMKVLSKIPQFVTAKWKHWFGKKQKETTEK
ncbi:MAG: glycosyltransferase [Bacteroidales bacterium]|nr:glycosyltransferase [Bacteroidales bacterium]